MKVLIITRSFVREVCELIKYAQRAAPGIEFFLVLPHDAELEEPLPASISIRRMYWISRIRTACYPPSLLSDLAKFQPDILHIFEEFSGLLAFQVVSFLRLLGQRSTIMVYSAENIFGNVRSILRLPMKYVMSRADLAFVCSNSVKQVLLQEGFSAPIEVFPLGVDTTKFYKFSADRLKYELKLDEKFVLGYIGRLLEIKGVFLLVEMIHSLPEHVHLLLIGSGPEEKSLRKVAAEYGMTDRIHFMGNVPYAALPDYINCMNVGIVPSLTTTRWKEQFGRVIVEMMSCELPVIGSRSGSIPEVLGGAGFVVEESNLQQFLSAVHVFMESPKICRISGKKGRERVRTFYSIEVMGKRFIAMYRQVMRHQDLPVSESGDG